MYLWIDSSRCIKSDCFPSWLHRTLPGSLSASLRVVVGVNTSVADEKMLWDTANTSFPFMPTMDFTVWAIWHDSNVTDIDFENHFHVHTISYLHGSNPSTHSLLDLTAGISRFLQRARPTWSPKDLHAAKEKLEAVHVNSTQQLKELLRQRGLNDICLEDVVGDVCVCVDTSEFGAWGYEGR